MATVVQTATNNSTSGTTVSCSFATLPAAGNAVIAVTTSRNTATFSGVADNQTGNTYSTVQEGPITSNTFFGVISWLPSVVGRSGTFTVTATVGASSPSTLTIMEVSGLAGTVDQTGSTQTGYPASSATVTASGANAGTNDLVVAVLATDYKNTASGVAAATTGYTSAAIYDGSTGGYNAVAQVSYKLVSSSETSQAVWTAPTSAWADGANCAIATFQATGGSPITETIKAITVAPGYVNSAVFSGSYTITSPTSYAPAPAQAVGYLTKTFDSTLVNGTTGNLFPFTYFGQNVTGTAYTQNADGSLTCTGNNPNSYNATVASAKPDSTTSSGIRGILFGGGGYFRVKFSYTGTQSGDLIDPMWFVDGILSLNKNNVQTTQGYNAVEVDTWEMNALQQSPAQPALTTSTWSLHNDYYNNGAKGEVNPSALLSGGNYLVVPSGSYNTPGNSYGWLWVPATGSTQGYAQCYFNDTAIGTKVYWNQWTAGQAFPPSGSNVANYLDEQTLVFIAGASSTATPLTITSVQVWQANTSSNISV